MWTEKLMEQFQSIRIVLGESLSRYTYTRTGGIADALVFPKTPEDIKQLINFAANYGVPIMVLGNASNVIVKDTGIQGIIMMLDDMTTVLISGETVVSDSGVKLIDLAKMIRDESLTGFEFACGIPGSVGGAVYMNAGAYGGDMKDVVTSVEVITKEGEYKIYSNQEMLFDYRHSIIQETGDIIVRTTLSLQKGDNEDISQKMALLTQMREDKQPLEYPSCGSVFKRPEGYFAGKLIQDAGLQGYRIGGVEVSKKHAGFMVNVDNGTATDYKKLISHVQKEVQLKFGVRLETEVKFIGNE